MDWKERALSLLKDSLEPVPSELNEIDWKCGLSDKSDRLAQHIITNLFVNVSALTKIRLLPQHVFLQTRLKLDLLSPPMRNLYHVNTPHMYRFTHKVLFSALSTSSGNSLYFNMFLSTQKIIIPKN